MRLSIIIAALRQRCPSFANRVGGAADFSQLPENAALAVPAAFVLPRDEQAGANRSANGYRQTVEDAFAVVVAVDNSADARGQAGYDAIHALRDEVFAALLGWAPDADHDAIVYDGGELVHMDRARLYYRLDFHAETELAIDVTRHGRELADLAAFATLDLGLDAIDPADPNRAVPGPDGRDEGGLTLTLPQD